MQLHVDVYIWCAFVVFVFVKFVSDVAAQVRAHGKTGIVSYPEDVKGSQRLVNPDPANPADQPFIRASGLLRNDLENLIPFTFVALAAALVQVDARIYLALLGLYALARIIHAVCILKGIQPLRTVSFLFGSFCALLLVVLTVIRLIPIFETF